MSSRDSRFSQIENQHIAAVAFGHSKTNLQKEFFTVVVLKICIFTLILKIFLFLFLFGAFCHLFSERPKFPSLHEDLLNFLNLTSGKRLKISKNASRKLV